MNGETESTIYNISEYKPKLLTSNLTFPSMPNIASIGADFKLYKKGGR